MAAQVSHLGVYIDDIVVDQALCIPKLGSFEMAVSTPVTPDDEGIALLLFMRDRKKPP